MIVVVPVCHKDAHLARLNLEWVKQLEGSVPYKAILSHDRSFDPGDLLAGFKEYFSGGVEEFIYDTWKGSQNWPVPQNYAWQKAARYMPKHHDCWLWWEQDAVPIKKDWLKLLEAEYAKANKPVLGHLRKGFTCGVMIYPANVGLMCISSLLTIDKPWDTVLCDLARRKIADTDLIQHGGKGHNVHFNGEIELSALQPFTAIFHPCKDGSLHKALSENTVDGQLLIPPTKPKQNILPDITVVITNFKRPELVTKAFESCLRVGISNIIVSASGCDDALAKVHSHFKELKPDVVITSIPNDLGCNEMWLRGVRLAKTKWVHILHDDDGLLPNFGTIEPSLSDDIGFVLFSAELRQANTGKKCGIVNIFKNLIDGIYDSEIILRHLLTDWVYTISPVQGVFRTSDVLSTLEECETISSKFLLRDKMMIGNDSLIWLRCAEKHKRFRFISKALIFFGTWDGSTTTDDLVHKRGRLLPIYNRIKQYFSSRRILGVCSEKRLGVIAYLPPPGIGGVETFLKNLKDWPPNNPVYLFSNHPWQNSMLIDDPVKKVGNDKCDIYAFVFNEALKIARKNNLTHFLYLEADCRFNKNGWDDILFQEFFKNQNAIVGGGLAVCMPDNASSEFRNAFSDIANKHNEILSDGKRLNWPVIGHGPHWSGKPVVFCNGAPAIYKTKDVSDLFFRVLAIHKTSPIKPPDCELGYVICEKHGEMEALELMVHLPQVLATSTNKIVPFKSKLHWLNTDLGCAVHDIKTSWRPLNRIPRFYLSGDLGDIIYGLKVIELFGIGELWLGPDVKTTLPPNSPISEKAFDFLSKLIERQPYIKRLVYSKTYPGNEIDYDLNGYRPLIFDEKFRKSTGIKSLVEMMAYHSGIHDMYNCGPWISAIDPKRVASFVVNRTSRYNDSTMPWNEILCRINGNSVFIGLPNEFDSFCGIYGRIRYYPVSDALEMAQIIAGADWFIGNQSFPNAIACGLGKKVYQETFQGNPDCVFDRPTFFNQKKPVCVLDQ